MLTFRCGTIEIQPFVFLSQLKFLANFLLDYAYIIMHTSFLSANTSDGQTSMSKNAIALINKLGKVLGNVCALLA